jgi:hypothetical protein
VRYLPSGPWSDMDVAIERHMDKVRPETGREGALGYVRREAPQDQSISLARPETRYRHSIGLPADYNAVFKSPRFRSITGRGFLLTATGCGPGASWGSVVPVARKNSCHDSSLSDDTTHGRLQSPQLAWVL